jgi:hypothetical protein
MDTGTAIAEVPWRIFEQGIFDLIGHIGMPLRSILYFVIPSRARNLCSSW